MKRPLLVFIALFLCTSLAPSQTTSLLTVERTDDFLALMTFHRLPSDSTDWGSWTAALDSTRKAPGMLLDLRAVTFNDAALTELFRYFTDEPLKGGELLISPSEAKPYLSPVMLMAEPEAATNSVLQLFDNERRRSILDLSGDRVAALDRFRDYLRRWELDAMERMNKVTGGN